MLKLLLIGGTAEARALADQLHQAGVDFIYSLAGVTRTTPLPFAVRRGGFGGIDGMAAWLRREHIDLIVDVSHPYAANISANARAAGKQVSVPVWAWQRPPWRPGSNDHWQPVADWQDAATRLSGYRRPLIALGSSPLRQPLTVSSDAHWLLRCVPGWHGPLPPRVTLIRQRGPFPLAQERELFQRAQIDVLVCRNSGGAPPDAKLKVASEQQIAVLMLQRPPPAPADQHFSDQQQLISSIIALI